MSELMIKPASRVAEVLLVEDNEGDIVLAQEAFRTAGMTNTLSVALDGEEALSMLRRAGRYCHHPRPDLILLDLNLPRMDGRELLTQIKADPNLKSIPVIVMSRSFAEIDTLQRSDLQADGYSTKPVDIDRLREVIATIDGLGLAIATRPTAGAQP